LIAWLPALGQVPADEPVTMSTEHPRLLLRPARLRLLKRERERTSMRWQQFNALISGNAPMPEPGFAYALYYRVADDAAAGRKAVAWALGPSADLRQQALVFDWCQDILSEAQARDLSARLEKGISQAPGTETIPQVRSRVFAAIALFDHVPKTPQRELERVVRQWWLGRMTPALKSGKPVVARDDGYALFEILHALRDNTTIDLRESVGQFFKDFPIEHLMSYYPDIFAGPDTDYRIGAERKPTDPDFQVAALSRAAELAMVGYDTNAPESQVLQGWLMHDRFILKSPFGTPYEFLWANPYQPGLSYYHVPLVYHNPDFGRLFIRSGWEDDARWFGYFDGVTQIYEDGRVAVLTPQKMHGTMSFKEAAICFAQTASQFRVKLDEEDAVFELGLAPQKVYLVEVDDEELSEVETDRGGIMELYVPRGREVGIRLREAPPGA
jgi:hypothetical protein